MENAVTNSNSKLTETWIDLDERCKKIFKDLQYHAFSKMEEDDVVDHIDDFLQILDLIKTSIFNTNQIRVNIFPLSLTGDAKVWWPNERDHKITAWEMLAGRWGINDSEDDTVSSDEEYEEHEFGNPPNDSFPKLYLNTNNEGDKSYHTENNGDTNKSSDMVLSGTPHSEELTNGQLNEKVCKVEKFEVLKYSVGDSKEFLSICILLMEYPGSTMISFIRRMTDGPHIEPNE
ncbi:hypothetical protein Tco_1248298 [Tanacetum coccineum]